MTKTPTDETAFAQDFWRKSGSLSEALGVLPETYPADAEFKVVAENLPVFCWLARADGYIVWYNRRWHDYCGTTPEEMAGWGWQKVHHPDYLPAVSALWGKSVAEGEPFEMTFPLRGADGVFRPFLTRILPVKDAAGTVLRWVGVNTEVGAQVKAEAERDANEARLAAAKEERDFIIALAAHQRTLTDAEQIMRLSAEQLGRRLGATRAGFYRLLPNERMRFVAGWTDWRVPLLSGDASTFTFGAKAERCRSAGEPLIVADSRADSGLETAARHGVIACIGIPIMRQGRVLAGLYVNQDRARVWLADEIGLVREVAELTWLAVERSEAVQAMQDRIVRQDSELADSAHALASAADAQAVAESQVRQLQKMEVVGQLTGGIAHDFNNMMAAVIGGLNLMQRSLARGQTDKLEKYIGIAMEGATNATALTQRLLAFSRQQPLAPQAVDGNKLTGSLADLLTRTLGEPIALETILGAGLWKARADANQLENAIMNLAVNARDAMPDGGKLTIETANTSVDAAYGAEADIKPGQYVLFAVSDTGSGMAPEVLAKAFEPFFTTKGVGKGTGLGLSQVFGFARQSGGHVRVYSEVGHGTTVKLYLPRFFGPETPVAAKRKAAAIPTGRPTEIILVVEDEVRVREFAIAALRELGYTVRHADSATAALHLIETGLAIDLLFTDIVMPDMTGRQLADRAQKTLPSLKIVYTTGYTRNAVVHNGVIDPGVHFLPKPFRVEDLALIIRDVLDEPVRSRPLATALPQGQS